MEAQLASTLRTGKDTFMRSLRPRRVGVYFAWSRPGETQADLHVIENRFPALFESRRMLFPRHAELADPQQFDQGIGGFLDHILRANFFEFLDRAATDAGSAITVERVSLDGTTTPLGEWLTTVVDTLIVISFDSTRTGQEASDSELTALRGFLAAPGNLLIIAPHHDIGDDRELEFRHHGDRTIPPEQRFGGFARTILAGLGVPVENRFGLHPKTEEDGSPAPIIIESGLDRLGLLDGVATFNAHAHLPHLERIGGAVQKLDVVARQLIDPSAPPHPFSTDGRTTFDALLQSHPGVFAGDLVVGDSTLFSSTAGGLESLRHFWANILDRERRVESGSAE